MTKPVAVLFADSHLQEGAWASRPSIKGDSFHSFRQLIDKAIEWQVPLIGAGDLIDQQRNSSGPIIFLLEQMERFAEENGRGDLLFIQGQHEMQEKPWFSGSDVACHLDGSCGVEVPGIGKVYGIDFRPHGKLEVEFDDIPDDVGLLVTHQVWGEFMGSITSPQGMLGNLPEQVRLVLTGDFHQTRMETIRNAGGHEMKVLSPGSTCMQEISEPEEKGYFVLFDDGDVCPQLLETRPVIRWDVMTMAEDVDRFAEEIGERINEAVAGTEFPGKPLLHIRYAARLSDVKHRVGRVVGDQAHVFLKEIPPEKPDVESRRLRREETGERHASTLESELSGYLEDREQGHLEATVRRLLEAPDSVTEMALIRKEMLED